MIIAYNNLLKNTVLSTTSQDSNYPLGNLLSDIPSIPYKSRVGSIVVTATFAQDTEVNCLCITSHNVSTIVLNDTEYTPLSTDVIVFGNVVSSTFSLTFLSDSDTVSIGNLFLGTYYKMPNPTAGYTEDISITNERTETGYGQVYGDGGVVLKNYDLNFRWLKREQKNIIRDIVISLRNIHPCYVSMTEDNKLYREPLFCTLDMTEFAEKLDTHIVYDRFQASLTLRESK